MERGPLSSSQLPGHGQGEGETEQDDESGAGHEKKEPTGPTDLEPLRLQALPVPTNSGLYTLWSHISWRGRVRTRP